MLHGPQAPPQGIDPFAVLHPQQSADPAVVQGLVGLGKEFENQFATGDGVVVSGGLALGLRVASRSSALRFFRHVGTVYLVGHIVTFSESSKATGKARFRRHSGATSRKRNAAGGL